MTTENKQPGSTLMGGEGGGGAGAGAGDANKTTGGGEWLKGVPDDLLAAIAPKKFDGVASLVKSYVHLDRKSGAEGDKLALPGKDAKPEDWEKWDGWNRLGRPDDPKGYEFKAPEGLPEGVFDAKVGEKWAGRFHKAGLSKVQATALFNGMVEDFNGQLETQNATAVASAEKGQTELKKAFGSQYDAKMELANRTFKQAFGEDLEAARTLRLADGSFLGDNPLLAKAFAGLGELLAEDGALPGGGSNATPSTQEKLAKFKSDPEKRKALTDNSHPNHQEVVKEWNELIDNNTGN